MNDLFYITVSPDQMTAEINCKESYDHTDVKIKMSLMISFLKDHKIIYGVEKRAIDQLLTKVPSDQFPIVIAQGKKTIHGIDGKIDFKQKDDQTDIIHEGNWDFREVMQIPTVHAGENLATIISPTRGEDGRNVHGKTLKALPGKPVIARAGSGVSFKEEEQSFYAKIEGQVSVTDRMIQVHSVYHVYETLSLEVGNLDFIGSIVIYGDVPTGYTVKAGGDVKIHGIVEAATIIAGGSIYVSGGLSGLKKGLLQADENIHIGYINQGIVTAGHSIHVENSIIHSECSAGSNIFCQYGNIIGGLISSGKMVEAADVGNRLSTQTNINVGLDKKTDVQHEELLKEKKELTETLKKVKVIGDMLTGGNKQQDAKMRVTMLRQKHSYEQISRKIAIIDEQLQTINAHLDREETAGLIVRTTLHPNVVVAFGKYERKINTTRTNVQLKLDRNDIVIHHAKE